MEDIATIVRRWYSTTDIFIVTAVITE